ncbi:MAG: FAD-dependent oxidoreductase [Endomicrobiales bacterium]|jgi:NADPH-dependent 2,4-dienoyl-CoA reductase/sulfur reductase-like enzyme/rhodanese-related sulfurtransferase
MKIIIVGGVAGGAAAAARLRRLDEKAEIIMFERGPHISYANCGLPYFISGEISDRNELLIQTPESFKERYNVDVRTNSEVIRINPSEKTVLVDNYTTHEETQYTYDKLIVAPGAEPLVPKILGVDSNRIKTLRTLEDADHIKQCLLTTGYRRVVIVGGGYIGLEMAEALRRLNIHVILIEMARQMVAPIDFEMAAEVHHHLKRNGIEFFLGAEVTAFREESDGLVISFKHGGEVKADFALLSIGIQPEIKLAKEAGLHIGETGGIVVNDFMQTSNEHIYAVGDAVEIPDPILGMKRLVALAGPAAKQARIAANNIVRGNHEKYCGSVGTAIAKVFDVCVGVTGYASKFLKTKGVYYASAIVHTSSHAGYYPGAKPMTVKVIFCPDSGKIYGAQAVGSEGVDKVIEVFSLACQYGLTVNQIKNMDQAYAPPFSSAKSPANIVCFVADNMVQGTSRNKSWRDVELIYDDSIILLDVRSKDEVSRGTMKNSLHIPLPQLRKRIGEIPRGKKIYVYCASGLRSYLATRILEQNGFDEVYNLSGGYRTWNAASRQWRAVGSNGHTTVVKDGDISNG